MRISDQSRHRACSFSLLLSKATDAVKTVFGHDTLPTFRVCTGI